jgi:3-phosphoshikimate 1-carboxyvinyltransferase
MKDRGDKKKPLSLEQELQALENRLVKLIGDRARLLKKSALARKGKNLSLVDSSLEKRLWQEVWRQKIADLGLDQRRCRSVFQVLNSLGTDLAETPEDRPFTLAPPRQPVQIDIQGPRDSLMTRMWLALGAGAGADLDLGQVVMNDPLYELGKALNQAGGQVAWEQDRIGSTGGSRLDFDRRVIFAGQDSLNTHLLILLAALHPGVSKITGASGLKLVNLQAVQDLLPQIGARATPLVPGSQGLPLRVEASGTVNDTIHLPESATWELAASLVLLAPLMQTPAREVAVHFPGTERWPGHLERVLRILEACSVQVHEDRGVMSVGRLPGPLPDHPAIPCDPVLNAYVHGLGAISGGRVLTRGEWPDWLRQSSFLQSTLEQFGLQISSTQAGLESELKGQPKRQIEVDLSPQPELAPLALCLGVGCGSAMSLKLEPDQDLPFAVDLLDSLHMGYELAEGELRLQGDARAAQDSGPVTIQVPSPWWGLGLSLLCLAGPKLVLQNPGELTSLWPRYWTLYRGLPKPSLEKRDTSPKEQTADASRKRRRIVD